MRVFAAALTPFFIATSPAPAQPDVRALQERQQDPQQPRAHRPTLPAAPISPVKKPLTAPGTTCRACSRQTACWA